MDKANDAKEKAADAIEAADARTENEQGQSFLGRASQAMHSVQDKISEVVNKQI